MLGPVRGVDVRAGHSRMVTMCTGSMYILVQGRTCRQFAPFRLYLGAAASAAAGRHAGTSAAAQLRKCLLRLAGIAVRLGALPERLPWLLCWGLLRAPHVSTSALPKILAAILPTWTAAAAASAGCPCCIPTACLHLCLHATSGEHALQLGRPVLAGHAPRPNMHTRCHKCVLDTFAAAGALRQNREAATCQRCEVSPLGLGRRLAGIDDPATRRC